MATNQFKIVNNSNSKGLKFLSATALTDNITINNVSIASAGQQSSQNFSRNYGGFKRLITVNFILNNDGTDKSTDASSKVTLSEQQDHLLGDDGVIQGVGVGDTQSDIKYTLTIYRDGATTDLTGNVEDISLNYGGQESNILQGSLNFYISSN